MVNPFSSMLRRPLAAPLARLESLMPIRRLRRRGAGLAVLDEVHPAATLGTHVNLGVREIPVEAIRGTAVSGPRLRGADFRPVPAARGAGWRGRWRHLERAYDALVPLPPIEVLMAGGEYWVTDGHNRVALARRRGLADIDADVTAVSWAGGPPVDVTSTDRRALLEAGLAQRAAASARGDSGVLRSLAAERLDTRLTAPTPHPATERLERRAGPAF